MATHLVMNCDDCGAEMTPDAYGRFHGPWGVDIRDPDGVPLNFCSGRCLAHFFDTGRLAHRETVHAARNQAASGPTMGERSH